MHHLSDFDFELPKELIAQRPASPRNHARLLVYDRPSGRIRDDYFYNLDKYLAPKTALVLNESRVERCRLRFGSTELFIVHSTNPYTVKALVRPGKRFRTGMVTTLGEGLRQLEVETLSVDEESIHILKLSRPLDDSALDKYRLTPFPPYIKQDESLSGEYQTVYARDEGSKAAPTAGLHFTAEQLKALEKRHPLIKLTLHVGLGTFAPVKSEDISKHKMHSEDYFISGPAAARLNRAGHITAVGTTSLRVLESMHRPFAETSGSTDIFITPGYEFKNVDSLITNFHLPRSTLLMLVAAFIGSVDEVQRVYAHAIERKYRFYSFGDAMLVI